MTEHMNIKDISKQVKAQLKKEFPNCKFSVTIERFSMGQSMCVALTAAPFAVFNGAVDANGYTQEKDYAQLNHFQLRSEPRDYICNGYYLTPEAWATLKRADEIGNGQNWDKSDIQTDYFDVNYYFDIAIGRWNKAFEQTA